jgi:hypothetical protein
MTYTSFVSDVCPPMLLFLIALTTWLVFSGSKRIKSKDKQIADLQRAAQRSAHLVDEMIWYSATRRQSDR